MEFSDALVYLKAGSKIHRKAWGESPKQLYVGVVNESVPRNTVYFSTPKGSEGVYIPSNQDILASDWEVTDVYQDGGKDIGELTGV